MAGRKYYTEDDRYRIPLEGDDLTYAAVIRRATPLVPKPLNWQALSTFLHDAAGRGTTIEPRFLSNTEIHVISRPVPRISDRGFVAHYTRFDHSLELRAEFDVPEDFFLRQGSFVVGLSTSFNPPPDSISVPGTRATPAESRGKEVASVEEAAPASGSGLSLLERNLEVGQAVASVAFAAAAMGWDAPLLGPSLGFTALGHLMGLTEDTDMANEFPVAAILIFPSPAYIFESGHIAVSKIKSSIMTTFTGSLRWNGRPYGVIKPEQPVDNVRRAIAMAEKSTAGDEHVFLGPLHYHTIGRHFRYEGRATLRQALQSRESVSAADLDAHYTMPRGNFRQFLLRCCYGYHAPEPRDRRGLFPCAVLPWLPRVNVFLFVNRVEGYETGLYCLARNQGAAASVTNPHHFEAQRLNIENETLPIPIDEKLYLFRRTSPELRGSHKQSAILVAMVAPFKNVSEAGYGWQIWDAGFLGEVLAVEAQAQGLSVSALNSQDYNWNLAFGIDTSDSCVISVYAVGGKREHRKTAESGKKLGRFKEAVSGFFHGGAKHAVP